MCEKERIGLWSLWGTQTEEAAAGWSPGAGDDWSEIKSAHWLWRERLDACNTIAGLT
jgi:hypothetical protein